MINDRQMINSRLYPISLKGLTVLSSLSLNEQVILRRKDVSFWPEKADNYSMAKNCIGMLLNLTLSPSKNVQETDKGVFVMLYLSDNMKPTVAMDSIDKKIEGPLGYQSEFLVSQIVQVLSSVASMCPDKSIRFYAYKLIEKFLYFCTDEARVFFLIELIEHCPFPSMNTAAINLLKDQVAYSFKHTETFSMFASPLLVGRFFPLIFQFKQDYITSVEAFWDDFSHIMQVLNFYYFLLQLDRSLNVVSCDDTKRLHFVLHEKKLRF
ncbi:hypothetical protein EDC96DRAFT_485259 [Choanephora cucurbitarum]|nr:hypothetical protein EDC96DRAFT_485259 [Choanephora cucurbitarum]